jgi:hypothetical protein
MKVSNKGKRARHEELAEILHQMTPGEVLKVANYTEEVYSLANSLSRTTKRNNKTYFSAHKHKSRDVVTITCLQYKTPTTVIMI